MDYERLPAVRVGKLDVLDVRGLFPDKGAGYERRELGEIEAIVQHHSADTRIAAGGARDTGGRLAGIYEHHTGANGWPGIGYHFIADNWGHVFMTGGAETIRYHVAGKNARSIGVCLLGNYEYYMPSMWALLALRELYANIRAGLGRPLTVTGHGEYALDTSPTSCPGATFGMWRAVIDTQLMPWLVGGDFAEGLLRDWLSRQRAL